MSLSKIVNVNYKEYAEKHRDEIIAARIKEEEARTFAWNAIEQQIREYFTNIQFCPDMLVFTMVGMGSPQFTYELTIDVEPSRYTKYNPSNNSSEKNILFTNIESAIKIAGLMYTWCERQGVELEIIGSFIDKDNMTLNDLRDAMKAALEGKPLRLMLVIKITDR